MSMYYLHRAGETTGPYAPGRLGMMLDTGEITATDQVCEVGTEEWLPAYMVEAKPEPVKAKKPAEVVARRVMKAPLVWLALLIAAIGFVTLFALHWAVGLLLIVLAMVVDRRHYVCGGCGNRIEKSSVVCPTCQARLVKRLPKKKG
jgi:DNA-directed RNA polymerase subunit RPC12/RpoP